MLNFSQYYKLNIVPISQKVVINGLLFLTAMLLTSCFSKKNDLTTIKVLKVNQSTLSTKEFADRLARQLKHLTPTTVRNEYLVKRAKQKVINNFMLQVITRDWAKKNKIRIHKDGDDGWLAEINSIRSSYPDDITFRRALSLEGLSLKEWQSKIRFSLLHKLVIKKINASVTLPTEHEMKIFFGNHRSDFSKPGSVKLIQIVLSSESEAKTILGHLKKKKSLSSLAKKFSITPEAKLGGHLGWIERGTSEVFDKAFSMRVGERSHIIKSPYGYHIFKVLKKKSPVQVKYRQVRAKISSQLIEKREQGVYTAWLEKQIQKTRVFKNAEVIDNIHIKTKARK